MVDASAQLFGNATPRERFPPRGYRQRNMKQHMIRPDAANRSSVALPGSVQPFGQRSAQSGEGGSQAMIIRSRVVVTMDGRRFENGAVVINGTIIS